MAKKKAKNTEPTGPFGPIFLGLVAVGLGASLAFFQLLGKDAESNSYFLEVSGQEFMAEGIPEEGAASEIVPQGVLDRKPRIVPYVKGHSRGGGAWEAKRTQLLTGSGALSVTFPEVNSWLRRNFRMSNEGPGGLALIPSTPQIGTTADLIHIYMPVTLTYFGRETETVLISRGRLSAGGSGLDYNPKETYLGSNPVPSALGQMLKGKIMEAYRSSEEYEAIAAALGGIQSVSVDAEGITLQR